MAEVKCNLHGGAYVVESRELDGELYVKLTESSRFLREMLARAELAETKLFALQKEHDALRWDHEGVMESRTRELNARMAAESRLDAASKLCEVYWNIAVEAGVSEADIRRKRDERFRPTYREEPPTVPDINEAAEIAPEAWNSLVVERRAPIASKLRGDDGIVRLAFSSFPDGHIKWTCPTSPTEHCEYNPVKDPAWDSCLHCGDPYERK